MPSPESQIRVAFHIKASDSLIDARSRQVYTHQKVVGVSIEDERVGLVSDIARHFTMPQELAYRIMDGAADFHTYKNFNSHKFSRVVAGVLDPQCDSAKVEPEYVNSQPEVPGLQPPLFNYEQATKKTATTIDLGAVGVVSTFNLDKGIEVRHSVIGLGDETEGELLLTCFRDMISLVHSSDLQDFYRSVHPEALEVDLWQLDPAVLSSSPTLIPAGQDVSR